MQAVSVLEQEIEAVLTYPLSPTQQRVFDELRQAAATSRVCILQGDAGLGKTSVLKALLQEREGVMVKPKQFLSLLSQRSPVAIEETFLEVVSKAMAAHQTVVLDDFGLMLKVVQSYEYPRRELFAFVTSTILEDASQQGNTLVFCTGQQYVSDSLRNRGYIWKLEEFTPEDYSSVARHYLEGAEAELDWEKIHRFAPALNAYQIKNASLWMKSAGKLATDDLTEHLEERNLTSNVDLDEVAPVDWHDLKGVDDVIRELEAKIALPFENDALAKELKLKPKRGVLLAGPPGTGKTTIGRALAHRLKGKFFLIDGTMVAGSSDFYESVDRVFEAAKENAPAVIFIDDADVIFANGDPGFYRYLLTQMDGLESASAERVCVMLTAMEASALPPAVLRSGRVELWLETRLPDEPARATILCAQLKGLPPPLCEADVNALAKVTRGFTGADLKAVVEDAKLLYAQQVAEGRVPESLETHFQRAVLGMRRKAIAYGKRRSAGFVSNAIGFHAE